MTDTAAQPASTNGAAALHESLAPATEHMPLMPKLNGRYVRLRPLTPADHAPLYQIATSDEVNLRWRFRGVIPSFEAFVNAFRPAEVSAQFAVTTPQSAQAQGLVVAYNTDPRSSHTYVGTMLSPKLARSGLGVEATALFAAYLFMTWPFHKLYFEVIDYNLDQFASTLGTLFVEEGVLREHQYYDGKYRDTHILAAYKDHVLDFCRSRQAPYDF